jgi:hypothetical protein
MNLDTEPLDLLPVEQSVALRDAEVAEEKRVMGQLPSSSLIR